MSQFFSIPNLTSQQVTAIEPWNVEVHRPQFADKNTYRQWCLNPTTEHCFVTGAIGKQPTLRVSEVNPIAKIGGLLVDFDALPPGQPELVILNNAPSDLRPAYVARTFSNHVRVIYRFEEVMPVFTEEIAKEFLKRLQRELKLRKLLPGFESESFTDPSHFFELGDCWTIVGDPPCVLQSNFLWSVLRDAYEKHKWGDEGPTIPIEHLREWGKEQFPDRLPPGGWDVFHVGGRCPRFWDESASDPTAGIVRETGVQFFSDGGGFARWAEIFGYSRIKQFDEARRGGAIKELWFDGASYWRKLPNGSWVQNTKEDTALALFVSKGLSKKPAQTGRPSEIEAALYDIQTLKRVRGAMPFVYRPDGPCSYNGAEYLNTSNVTPIMPVTQTVTEWGQGFPWLAQFLFTLFDPQDQLDFFVGWLAHFYRGAITQSPRRGLALFIAGPAGVGKNLLSQGVLGQLMGGKQDAGKFLLGGDKFNDELLRAALWTVNDEVVASDPRQRSQFSQLVKQVVANDSITMRAMFRSGFDAEWLGRIVVTMNDDPGSLQMLPECDSNILDKLMLLRTKVPEVSTWPSDAEIAAELPFFGAFLRDWSFPGHVLPPPNKQRFGVNTFKHPDLLRAAGELSPATAFEDQLELWRTDWFGVGGSGAADEKWEGTPGALVSAMQLNGAIKSTIDRHFSSPTKVGILLGQLRDRQLQLPPTARYIFKLDGSRKYTISRP